MTTSTPLAVSAFRRHWITLLAGTIVSIVTLGLVFSDIDFDKFWEHLRQANERFIGAMVIAYLLVIPIRTWRWQALVREPLNFWPACYITNIGYFLNTALPLRLGELARVILMSREPGQGAASGLSALTLERLFDLSFALLCLGIGLAMLPANATLPSQTTSTLGVMIVVTITGILIVASLQRTHRLIIRLARFMTGWLPQVLAQKLNKFVEDTLYGLETIMERKRLASNLFGSLLLWGIYVGYYQLGLRAFFQEDLSIGVSFLVLGFVALGAAAPSLPGAVGVYHAAAVLALRINDYDTSVATSFAWGAWAVHTLINVVVGLWSLWVMGLSVARLTTDIGASLDKLESPAD